MVDRHEHQCPEDDGDKEPLYSFHQVLSPRPAAQGEPGGCSGNEEEERHVVLPQNIRQSMEGQIFLVTGNPPVIAKDEGECRVEGNKQQHC